MKQLVAVVAPQATVLLVKTRAITAKAVLAAKAVATEQGGCSGSIIRKSVLQSRWRRHKNVDSDVDDAAGL